MPTDVHAEPGQGIQGAVSGRRVFVGGRAFMQSMGVPKEEIVGTTLTTTRGSGEAHVVVALDGHVAGVIVMADELRRMRSESSSACGLKVSGTSR
jgi:Cu+-exporting ATPase